jgi:hypothetical protein
VAHLTGAYAQDACVVHQVACFLMLLALLGCATGTRDASRGLSETRTFKRGQSAPLKVRRKVIGGPHLPYYGSPHCCLAPMIPNRNVCSVLSLLCAVPVHHARRRRPLRHASLSAIDWLSAAIKLQLNYNALW